MTSPAEAGSLPVRRPTAFQVGVLGPGLTSASTTTVVPSASAEIAPCVSWLSATDVGRREAGLSTPTNRGGVDGNLAPADGFGRLGFSSVSTMAAPVVTGGVGRPAVAEAAAEAAASAAPRRP